MKRLLPALLFLLTVLQLRAQDIPLFSQKLTHSFIYNPAMAGHDFGSFTASYRSNYSNVSGAPTTKFISIQTPILNGRFGIGANAFQEKVNVMDNTYASAAFAYHLELDRFNKISVGVAGEYNSMRLRSDLSDLIESGDEVIQRYSAMSGKIDFSFGVLYENQFLIAGLAANRLSTAWFQSSDTKALSNFYSAYVQGKIPMRGELDMLEPYFAFRKFSETNKTIDFGVFYTFNNKIIAGLAMRNGSVLSTTAGFYVTSNLMLGYSREMILGGVGGFTGSSNEFTLRLDFNKQASKAKFNSDYKSSLSYRRKTMGTSGVKKTSGSRTPKQLNKAQKRVAAYSPNRRYQNTSKLSGGRKSPSKASHKKYKPPKRRRR